MLLCSFYACKPKTTTYTPAPAASKPTRVTIASLTPPFWGNRNNEDSLFNPTTKEGIFLGRNLFYEKALSLDGTVSCASCHKQEAAFTDGLAFSKGIGGNTAARSAMSLSNLAWQNRFFWDGRDTSIENQAAKPIENPHEMGESLANVAAKLQASAKYPPLFLKAFGSQLISPLNVQKALAQFERTLISSNSKYDRSLRGQYTFTDEEALGKTLFFTHPVPDPRSPSRGANCSDCHTDVFTLSSSFISGSNTGSRSLQEFRNNGLNASFLSGTDVGLQTITGNPQDQGKFKVPTLRNIALTAPYMHDGRFGTLEQVLDHYNSDSLFFRPNVDLIIKSATNINYGKKLALTEAEKRAVIAFLNTLTDSTFTTDTAYAAPK